jgi:hypothetical protein
MADLVSTSARLRVELSGAKAELETVRVGSRLRGVARVVCLLQVRDHARTLAVEVNTYRETEGAIARALAAAAAAPTDEEAKSASPAGDGEAVPEWLRAEASAGSEARSRSLRLQVMALRRALLSVARRSLQEGADPVLVTEDLRSAGVEGLPTASSADGDETPPARAEPLDTVLMAPGPIHEEVTEDKPVVEEEPEEAMHKGPTHRVPQGDAGEAEPVVGLLGLLLAPPIAVADALASVTEALFGTDEEEELSDGEEEGASV